MNKQILNIALGAIGGFATCWMLVGTMGCGKSADVIAVVNGDPITMADYYKYMEYKPQVQVKTASGPATLEPFGPIGFQTMQDLIGQKVLMQLAKDKGIYPTEADVNKELEFKKKLNPNYLNAATQNGLTFDMIRESLTIDLIQEKLLTDGLSTSDAEIEKYKAENASQFIDPAKYDLSIIFVQDTPTQKKVDQELSSGQSFTQVAIRYSAAPGAKEANGKYFVQNQMPTSQNLPKDFYAAVKNLKEGTSTGWIQLVDGKARLFLNKRVPEQKIVLDDAKKELLRRELTKRKGAEARDISRQVLVKLGKSKIDVRKTAYQKLWEDTFKQYMNESKLEGLTGSTGN